MAKILNGFSAETPLNLQLDAGVFLKDIAITDGMTEQDLRKLLDTSISSRANMIGATSGGGTFTVVPTLRNMAEDLDGARMKIKGLMACDGVEVKLATTIKEITVSNLAFAIGNATVTGNKIVPKFEVTDEDYAKNLVWVGSMSKSDDLLVIVIENAMNTSGLSLTFTDKGTGGVAIEAEPFLDLAKMDHMPVSLYRLTKATE